MPVLPIGCELEGSLPSSNEPPLDLELSISTIRYAIGWLTYKGNIFVIIGSTILVEEKSLSLLSIFIIFTRKRLIEWVSLKLKEENQSF